MGKILWSCNFRCKVLFLFLRIFLYCFSLYVWFVIIFLFTYFQVPVALCRVFVYMRVLCSYSSWTKIWRGFSLQFLNPLQLFLCGGRKLRCTYKFLSRRFWATIVGALYVDDPSSVRVKSCLAPRSPWAPPANLPVPGASIEPEPVATDVDAHLPLLAEAVWSEGINASSN